jgi:hypothetical protein
MAPDGITSRVFDRRTASSIVQITTGNRVRLFDGVERERPEMTLTLRNLPAMEPPKPKPRPCPPPRGAWWNR